MENEMKDEPVARTVRTLQTRDPIDVVAGLDLGKEGPVPADRELKSGFEVAWDLAH
jgi:hypothetical protein